MNFKLENDPTLAEKDSEKIDEVEGGEIEGDIDKESIEEEFGKTHVVILNTPTSEIENNDDEQMVEGDDELNAKDLNEIENELDYTNFSFNKQPGLENDNIKDNVEDLSKASSSPSNGTGKEIVTYTATNAKDALKIAKKRAKAQAWAAINAGPLKWYIKIFKFYKDYFFFQYNSLYNAML